MALGNLQELLHGARRPVLPAAATIYAAWRRNSTFTESNGKITRPSLPRSSTPVFNSAVTSVWTAFTSRPTRRAISRIDRGPAPHMAFSNCQRLAVSTFQRSSGVAKVMRAAFSLFPVFQTRTKSAMASFGERTSRTTVFTIPPHYVAFEVGHELLWRVKCIGVLGRTKMSVVALSCLIVVAYDAYAVYHVCQSILE